MLERAGMVEGLAVVKRRRSEGSVAKSLSIEIVRIVFARFSSNARTFLQECERTQGFLAAGRLTCVGRCVWTAPRATVRSRARCIACQPRWAKICLAFSWRIEIAFHFNSELNFDN